MKNVLFIDFYNSIVRLNGDKYYGITPNFEVWDALKTIKPDYLFILENEPSDKKADMRDSDFKLEYYKRALVKYMNLPNTFVEFNYCPSKDPLNEYRKPNVAMYARMLSKYVGCDHDAPFADELASCLVIGHEDDRICAEKIGCKFLPTDDFVRIMNEHTQG